MKFFVFVLSLTSEMTANTAAFKAAAAQQVGFMAFLVNPFIILIDITLDRLQTKTEKDLQSPKIIVAVTEDVPVFRKSAFRVHHMM